MIRQNPICRVVNRAKSHTFLLFLPTFTHLFTALRQKGRSSRSAFFALDADAEPTFAIGEDVGEICRFCVSKMMALSHQGKLVKLAVRQCYDQYPVIRTIGSLENTTFSRLLSFKNCWQTRNHGSQAYVTCLPIFRHGLRCTSLSVNHLSILRCIKKYAEVSSHSVLLKGLVHHIFVFVVKN